MNNSIIVFKGDLPSFVEDVQEGTVWIAKNSSQDGMNIWIYLTFSGFTGEGVPVQLKIQVGGTFVVFRERIDEICERREEMMEEAVKYLESFERECYPEGDALRKKFIIREGLFGDAGNTHVGELGINLD